MSLRDRRESRLQRSIGRAVRRRRIFPYLAGVTIALGVLSGFLVTLLDRRDFPTFGTGVWWAIVTLATVGYGDVVPTTPWGRVLGSAVIVLGVTFLAFLTATVTSYFISSEQERGKAEEIQKREATDEELRELLHQLEARLASIEQKLDR